MNRCQDVVCPTDKVCNPQSGHCVKKTGRIARSIPPRNANGRPLFNVVTQQPIPSWAHVYESRHGVYDNVRSLANLIDRESPKFPQNRRDMTDNEQIEIMKRARHLRWKSTRPQSPPSFSGQVPSPLADNPPPALQELHRRYAPIEYTGIYNVNLNRWRRMYINQIYRNRHS